MPEALAEALILDALREEAARRQRAGVLLIGMQSAATVGVANQLVGSERVTLLHLDRASGAMGLGLGNRESFLGDENSADGQPADLGPFSVVAVNVDAAKSYRLLREILRQTARQVADDGVVFVAGPRKGGAEVAARTLEEVFESVVLGTYRKGHRIYRAAGLRVPEQTAAGAATDEPVPDVAGGATLENPQQIETVNLRGHDLQLLLDDRIFARGRLDPATRMLAEAFEVPQGAAVLDLGAGNGVLGILAALLAPSSHVWLVDSDPLAVQVSRKNAALNGAANVSVQLSDVLRDLPDQTFDLVLMNPPFHRGRVHDASIAERFIAEASRALRPRGAIYVVCNRFLRYEPTLERLVGPTREVVGDARFKVLLARRPANPRLQSGQKGGRHGRTGQRRPE
jgi:16S rRNA (guanine1207-N2)-methyltransferase